MRTDTSNIKRFFSKVDIKSKSECWNWLTFKDKDGYGKFWNDNINVRSHRYSFYIYNGYLDKDLVIMHSCDNPSCVNPLHLSQGTSQDNTADKFAKGRCAKLKGEKCARAKLKEHQVLDIRARRHEDPIHLADLYKVSFATIYDVWNYRSWTHI